MPGGTVKARRLAMRPEAYVPHEAKWAEQQRTVRDSEDALRRALLGATDEDPFMRDYLHDWADCTKEVRSVHC